MLLGIRHPRLRCIAVWCAVTACCAAVALVVGRPLPSPSLSATFEDTLVGIARCAVMACAGWLWLTATLAVIEAWRGCPATAHTGVRRWVLVACGVAALSGAVSGTPPATAATDHHPHAATSLPYPDRAVAPLDPDTHRSLQPQPPPTVVVVQPGDSLWVIAARTLRPGATAADVTLRWHALYAANQARIGPDPDLIEPGLRLLLPGKDPS